MAFHLAVDQIADDDAFGVAVDHHDIQHFPAGNISTLPAATWRIKAL
jgi:hypothetical protein